MVEGIKDRNECMYEFTGRAANIKWLCVRVQDK